jgi:hypothetical protein
MGRRRNEITLQVVYSTYGFGWQKQENIEWVAVSGWLLYRNIATKEKGTRRRNTVSDEQGRLGKLKKLGYTSALRE